MKTGIIFDLDGTLLDTLEDLKDSVNYALAQYGCPPRTLSEIRDFIGNGARRLIQLSLPGLESDPPVEDVLATYQAYYADHNQVKTGPYKGIPQALEEISKRWPIAIVSNKPDIAVKPMCASYFGSHIFALGETADCPRKPAPDMVYKGMAAIGVEKCIYVGDSEVDVITARNAGAKCLSVLWGFRDEDVIREQGGEYFCSDPAKMVEMLESMM